MAVGACLSVCGLVANSVCLSIRLCLFLYVHQSCCLSAGLLVLICLSVWPPIHLSVCVCTAPGMQQECQAAAPVFQQLVFYSRHLTGRLRLSNTNRYTCNRLRCTDGLHTCRPHADIQISRRTYSPSCRHTYSPPCRHTHRHTFSPSCSVTNI